MESNDWETEDTDEDFLDSDSDISDETLTDAVLEHNFDIKDFYTLELERLRSRERVLSTICGFQEHPEVIRAVTRVQTAYRSHRDLITTQLRMQRSRNAIIRIQGLMRGRTVRNSPIGRAVAHVGDLRNSINLFEKLLMHLTAMGFAPETLTSTRVDELNINESACRVR